MTTALAINNSSHDIGEAIERVLIAGDLSKLNPDERVSYYNAVCRSVGLNPLTKPFEYITLNSKLTLYARRDCTDQLRKIHSVSIKIIARELVEDCYVVTARASDHIGREDESIGAVSIAGLKGEAKANAMMKAETKAKRRVTLSICGLGMLDETEVETIPDAKVEVTPAPKAPTARPATSGVVNAAVSTPPAIAKSTPGPDPRSLPGSATMEQIKRLVIAMGELNITDREPVRAWVKWACGETVDTRKQLTFVGASKCITKAEAGEVPGDKA